MQAQRRDHLGIVDVVLWQHIDQCGLQQFFHQRASVPGRLAWLGNPAAKAMLTR